MSHGIRIPPWHADGVPKTPDENDGALPRGASWKRTHARSSEPLDAKQKPAVCEHCEARAVRTVYEHNDGAQFYSTTIWETHCTACGIYVVHSFQAPG